jgi:hypothetical protein
MITLLFSMIFLAACGPTSITTYANNSIQFVPQAFFNNKLVAEGFVRDRSGKMTRYFTANITATWSDSGGVLDEVFEWSDGERQARIWQFTKTGDQTYVGSAGDVIGQAKMTHSGNAIRMTYRLDVPLANGRTIAVDMDDWLFQVSDKSIVNVTQMTKWGLNVGEVILTMRVVD